MQTKRRQKSQWNSGRPSSFRYRRGTSDPTRRASECGIDQQAIKNHLNSRVVVIESNLRFGAPHVPLGTCEQPLVYNVNPVQAAGMLLRGMPFEKFESAAEIAMKIDAVIADDDMYEPGEPRPSPEAANKAKDLIASTERREFPKPKISVYFGEIDITWKVQNRLLRLIVFPDSTRPAVLYFQTDKGEALTRGESVEVSGAEDLSLKLDWLLG